MHLFNALFFGVGKTISNVGQTLFGTLNWLGYFAANSPIDFTVVHKATLPVTCTANLMIVFASRFPAIKNQGEIDTNITFDLSELNNKQQFALASINLMGIAYAAITTLIAIYGGSILAKLIFNSITNNIIQLVLICAVALYVASGSIMSFYAYNYQKISLNAKKIIIYLIIATTKYLMI